MQNFLIASILTIAVIGTPGTSKAADADAAVQKSLNSLLAAIEANDRAAFVAGATDEVKKGMTKDVMAFLNTQLGPRLKKGFDAAYLCQLNQRGHQVHLWKATFKDEGDDIVFRLVLKDGNVAGFFLQ